MKGQVNQVGFLEIILGPMFSGKTTHLVNLYHTYIKSGLRVLVINYSADTRYHDTMLSTHDKKMIPCTFAFELVNVQGSFENYNAILINEAQFFPDLYETVVKLVNVEKKRLHLCGLDGDFKRQKFGKLLDLIPICDTVTKLHSNCTNCQQPAIFSHRITKEQEQVIIGSTNYVPLCRTCYNIVNLN
uniref:thymidine kinase n=1 Tax=viral metagenome TaxID=1070528 RepID=A0A6C0JHH7_9ZZZZ